MESQKESELKQFLTEIADAIREVRETKELINAQDMREEILELGTSGLPLPVEVSTEEEMTALLESGKVGGIYKYTGTTGTYENGALYELTEEESDPLQGTWVFNDVLVIPESVPTGVKFNFVSNNTDCSVFVFTSQSILSYKIDISAYNSSSGWTNDAYKTIVISSTYDELIIVPSDSPSWSSPELFLSWLQANATKQVSKQFTKLILKSDLEEITINENGEYSGEYSNITVEVPRPQLFAPVISLGGSILTISDDNNGDFVNTYRVLVDGVEKVSYNYTFSEIDLSTLELEDGTYTITIVATGIDFVDSVASNGVSYEAKNYLTFSSPETFTLNVSYNTKYWDGIIEYSTDAKTWTEWDGTNTLSSSEDGNLYMRGTGNTIITGSTSESRSWVLTGSNISCNGNIEYLLDYQTVINGEHPTMGDHCYTYMFHNNSSLITPPELPATTLTPACYSRMFYQCSNLTVAPQLPATELTSSCYDGMFYKCTSLVVAPKLPATTLAIHCYNSMFWDCTSLTTAPELPATTLVYGCYYSMFYGCTSLNYLIYLPATTLANYCYSYMFRGCTNIWLSETQNSLYSKEYRIPTNGTGTTADNALNYMFSNIGNPFMDETPSINTTYYTPNEIIPNHEKPVEIVGTWVFNDTIDAIRNLPIFISSSISSSEVIMSLQVNETITEITCDYQYNSTYIGLYTMGMRGNALGYGTNGSVGFTAFSNLGGATLTIYDTIYNSNITINSLFPIWLKAYATKQ